jgi:hypothetical protein
MAVKGKFRKETRIAFSHLLGFAPAARNGAYKKNLSEEFREA